MLRSIVRVCTQNVSHTKYVQTSTRLVRPRTFQQFKFYCTNAPESTLNHIQNEKYPDTEKKIKIFTLEMEALRQEGKRIPDSTSLKPEQWQHMLSLKSRSARMRYYTFLWGIEKKVENSKAKKEKRKVELEEKFKKLKEEREQETHITYGLHRNTMFLRIYDSTMDRWHNNKLVKAMQFDQKLVVDCSYESHMVHQELRNTAKQLMLMFADNRNHREPFDLHFCNANLNGPVMRELKKFMPTMLEPQFPINIHEDSFLSHFPKERLVYLTPHCKTYLHEFNPDDVYIIGAMVDKMNNEPLSLAKAKSQNLRMAKLPLDHYLEWGAGSGKSLTLDQMIKILLDIKQTGDWNKALVHVPRRKLVDFRKQEEGTPMKVKLSKFKEYSFNVETWGAKKLLTHSKKHVEKRLKSKNQTSEVLENIFKNDRS